MFTSVAELVGLFVPISRFNRGEAKRIFDEVVETGVKIVLKNDTPACVLVAPQRYDKMIEMLEDYELLLKAEKRMTEDRIGEGSTHEEIMEKLGITQEDLDKVEVDID